MEALGAVNECDAPFITDKDTHLLQALKHADDVHTTRIDWPTILLEPILEYSDAKVFCMALPWLYTQEVSVVNKPGIM